MSIVESHAADHVHTITLNDPSKRNAMGLAMFDGLDAALDSAYADDDARIVVVRGNGKAFCAGFDLAAAVDEPECMGEFIARLSDAIRRFRRLPGVVIMAAHGAAIAGGCALLTAGDFIFVARDALLGYPVHPIGVSPAVTIPSLSMKLGDGAARSMLLGGALLTGEQAYACGLASHSVDAECLDDAVKAYVDDLLMKGPDALRSTKAWLNTLDGSLDNARFDGASAGSCELTMGEEAHTMLRNFWKKRTAR
jgi:methylglutaconyl-CoA hydratase